jgi:pectinesterase
MWTKNIGVLCGLCGWVAVGIGAGAASDGHEIVVTHDGSGDFRTVQAAVDSLAKRTERAVIHVKPGIYEEHVKINADKPPIRLYGDDAQRTFLTFNLVATMPGPDGKPIGTFRTSSTEVWSNDFEADDVTFANSTGRDLGQALALSTCGDRQVYRRCRLLGWQDTLYTQGKRAYFEDCYIEGGVDFIFGPSTVVFNHCTIHSKRKGYLTAASTPKDVSYGYTFFNCTLTAAQDVVPGSVFLGRPWRDYAQVTFLYCELGSHINHAGWLNWHGTARDKTARYSEYHNGGPGSPTDRRVEWSHQLTDEQARAMTVSSLLAGEDHWDPQPSEPIVAVAPTIQATTKQAN